MRAVKKAMAEAGEHLSNPPFGDMVDSDDRKKWIVDGEAADSKRHIFELCVAGNGPMRISKILREEKRLTATAHVAKAKGKELPENPYDWDDSAIVKILERMEYCGHTVNFKTYSKSNKLKKRYDNPAEKQKIFRNT